MKDRTKTPVQIHEQFCRVFDYISRKDWEHGEPSDEIQKKHGEFLDNLHKTTWRYIENIYKLAGVLNCYNCPEDEANNIWANFHATKDQYAK